MTDYHSHIYNMEGRYFCSRVSLDFPIEKNFQLSSLILLFQNITLHSANSLEFIPAWYAISATFFWLSGQWLWRIITQVQLVRRSSFKSQYCQIFFWTSMFHTTNFGICFAFSNWKTDNFWVFWDIFNETFIFRRYFLVTFSKFTTVLKFPLF